MADTVDKATRSRMMRGIRAKDTKPEMIVRRGLHAMGFRFRLHARELPGKPDLVFPKYRAVIFVHGCFWHGHECAAFRWPKTRVKFWKAKILGNRARDKQAMGRLRRSGWRTKTIWECALAKAGLEEPGSMIERTSVWLRRGT